MQQFTKQNVMIFYAVLILVLAMIGFFISKKQKKEPVMGAVSGAVVGLVISVALWFGYAKDHVIDQ